MFIIAAGVGVIGCLISFFLVPDTTRFDLAAEDEKWRQYLVAHGWDGLMGDGTVREHRATDVVAPSPSLLDDADRSSDGGEEDKDAKR